MDNNIAVKVENVTKIYKLYDDPIDRLKESINLLGKKYHKDFYALHNLSLEIQKGDTIGLIGKNGSGKSTLLKIITGVLTPTQGNVSVNGKVSALLELGAGFNPEFTGIENIYLNGTIMGYARQEIDRKIEDILSFADIGDFIYQPVKTYSSGMFARLAFAVAINVDPDILVVDEALSVGDFMFQHKCLQKFREFQDRGKTILFVSHSTQQIIQYCNKAVLLHGGEIVDISTDVERLVFKYENLIRNSEREKMTTSEDAPIFDEDFCTEPNQEINEYRFGTQTAVIRDVYFISDKNSSGNGNIFNAGSRIKCKVLILSKVDLPSIVVGVSIKDVNGIVLWGDNTLSLPHPISLKKGRNILTFEFDVNVVPGEYLFYAGMADISRSERVELDQRWPVKKLSVVSKRNMTEGYVYAPSEIRMEYHD